MPWLFKLPSQMTREEYWQYLEASMRFGSAYQRSISLARTMIWGGDA
jgi:hypothetical protein